MCIRDSPIEGTLRVIDLPALVTDREEVPHGSGARITGAVGVLGKDVDVHVRTAPTDGPHDHRKDKEVEGLLA
eukprot:15195071-Alexandrium_andersonii.AAC.1